MPKIEIKTCDKTPNYCALEAIARAMRNNYTKRKNREYQYESIIKVESGRTLKVTEIPRDLHADSPCSCKYKVEKVEI
jgi:hypothetical protein